MLPPKSCQGFVFGELKTYGVVGGMQGRGERAAILSPLLCGAI